MEPVISIRNVNHYFGAGALRKQILFDISADILPGEIVINTGPSGSGKTTLLTLVGGLRSVQEGSLETMSGSLAHPRVRWTKILSANWAPRGSLEQTIPWPMIPWAMIPWQMIPWPMKARTTSAIRGSGIHQQTGPPA